MQRPNGESFNPNLVLRRALAVSLGMLACALPNHANADPIVQAGVVAGSNLLPGAPDQDQAYVQLGNEDESAVYSTGKARTQRINASVSYAGQMGASVWRIIMDRKTTMQKNGMAMYDSAATIAHQNGLTVTETIGCSGTTWTPSAFTAYITKIINHNRSNNTPVSEYSICNEPNYTNMLRPMPDMTVPQTYRKLYIAGYNTIQSLAKGTPVHFGEASSGKFAGQTAVQFMQAIWACPEDGTVCDPVIADDEAYHPYELDSQPMDPSPPGGEVGIGNLQDVETATTEAFQSGLFKTPDGEQPKLNLSELAYLEKPLPGYVTDKPTPDVQKELNTPKVVAKYYSQIMAIVCDSKDFVDRVSIYGSEAQPSGSSGTFFVRLRDANGYPQINYKTLQMAVAKRPDCFGPAVAATAYSGLIARTDPVTGILKR